MESRLSKLIESVSHERSDKIINYIINKSICNQTEIAYGVGCPQGAVSLICIKLVSLGLLKEKEVGAAKYYTVTYLYEEILELIKEYEE